MKCVPVLYNRITKLANKEEGKFLKDIRELLLQKEDAPFFTVTSYLFGIKHTVLLQLIIQKIRKKKRLLALNKIRRHAVFAITLSQRPK